MMSNAANLVKSKLGVTISKRVHSIVDFHLNNDMTKKL